MGYGFTTDGRTILSPDGVLVGDVVELRGYSAFLNDDQFEMINDRLGLTDDRVGLIDDRVRLTDDGARLTDDGRLRSESAASCREQ